MMNALFSTAYLPPVAYMAAMVKQQRVAIETCETYTKQTYRNRATIATANGLLDLSIPVVKRYGNHTKTADVGIAYAEPWNVRHWRAIESAYRAAPFFLYYADALREAIMCRHETLLDLNQQLLAVLLRQLKCNVEVNLTEDFLPYAEHDFDLRERFTPKHPLPADRFPEYSQVFATKWPFAPNLSVIDLLFNLGPEARGYLLALPEIMLKDEFTNHI